MIGAADWGAVTGDVIGRVESLIEAPAEPRCRATREPLSLARVHRSFARALRGLSADEEVLVLTWLHLADRQTLRVHPRGDEQRPEQGVFGTRSPHRPNPIGIHRGQSWRSWKDAFASQASRR